MASPLLHETVWFEKSRCHDAERAYHEKKSGVTSQTNNTTKCSSSSSSLVNQIAQARQHIQNSLNANPDDIAMDSFGDRMQKLEEENNDLKKVTDDLRDLVKKLEQRIGKLEVSPSTECTPMVNGIAAEEEEEDDDDFELFGSDDEADDAAAAKLKEERIKAYTDKKAKKTQVIAKSGLVLDVKPWDDETDMAKLEELVRTIEMDGLLWGASKLVAVGYGIKKLQISCVIEDDKVSTDDLDEQITAFEDFVQSMDIAAFNKI